MDFKLSIIQEYSGFFLSGTLLTIGLSIIGIILGTIIGLIFALGKLSKNKLISIASACYIECFRGTPLLVQLLIIYFGVVPFFMNKSDGLIAAIVALSLNASSYIAETIRAGIESVPRGQIEAARSLGMNHRKAMQYIVLPQAMRKVLPPLGNAFITLIKDSSLASTIATPELMYWANAANAQYFRIWESFITAAVIYLFLTVSISALLRHFERRID